MSCNNKNCMCGHTITNDSDDSIELMAENTRLKIELSDLREYVKSLEQQMAYAIDDGKG